jgi:hypothetical protein
MPSGTNILSTDYNTIRSDIESIWGTGSGQRGYGQPMVSSPVTPGPGDEGDQITKAQWDALAADIVNTKVHQDGVIPSIVSVEVGAVIGYGSAHPNTNYRTLVDQAIANRFNIGPGRFTVTNKSNTAFTGTWKRLAFCELTITFSNSNEARYFFNSGGKLRFTSSRTGGSNTAQNNSWTNLLTSIGTFSVGATSENGIGIYNLTNNYVVLKQESPSVPYLSSVYKIEARCVTQSNNINGTENQFRFKVTFDDSYIDKDIAAGFPNELKNPPGDAVDGTIAVVVDELKATGPINPSPQTFNITSPDYTPSTFTIDP